MKNNNLYKALIGAILVAGVGVSCTKLESKVYSVVPNSEFWSTPAQITAGIAPAYTAMQGLPTGSIQELQEATTDEMIIPTRGADWLDGNEHTQEWLHTWDKNHQNVAGTWTELFGGIGQANFTLSIVNNLNPAPAGLTGIDAELHVVRDYFYWQALDIYGNVPYVTSFNIDPSSVKQSKPADVYDSILTDLLANVPLLSSEVIDSTYGHFNQWAGYALLAKLYMNAQVYTGVADWADAGAMCDKIIKSGNFSLLSNYFDNFSNTNSTLIGSGNESIFVIPFDNVNIGGGNWQNQTLHYQNQINFGLSGQPWNGFASDADFYATYDTTSTRVTKGGKRFRTFNDQRAGQFLEGQQYKFSYTYPPNTNVIDSADDGDRIFDQTYPLNFTAVVPTLSDASLAFRSAGVRNIKYFPQAGTSGNQSNDFVVFRLADILLMKAEVDLRMGTNLGEALQYVNQVRTRAYYGLPSQNWTTLTLPLLLQERGRELAWEMFRRDDLIRFEVADGIPYWSGARNPGKSADPGTYTRLFPIPAAQMIANPNLIQNLGY